MKDCVTSFRIKVTHSMLCIQQHTIWNATLRFLSLSIKQLGFEIWYGNLKCQKDEAPSNCQCLMALHLLLCDCEWQVKAASMCLSPQQVLKKRNVTRTARLITITLYRVKVCIFKSLVYTNILDSVPLSRLVYKHASLISWFRLLSVPVGLSLS